MQGEEVFGVKECTLFLQMFRKYADLLINTLRIILSH
jgi:hypothetical protein